MNLREVIIIGAGPCGISCALMLERCGIHPLIIEKDEPGGLLLNAQCVENYPGFHSGIQGKSLAKRFMRHLNGYNPEITIDEARSVAVRDGNFRIRTVLKDYQSRFLVAAPGTLPKKPDFTVAADARHMIFTEVKRMAKLKNKEIVIIGSGDCAFDYALSLQKNNRVTIMIRSNRPKCNDALWKKFRWAGTVRLIADTRVQRIENHGTGVQVTVVRSGGMGTYLYDYAVLAIGREPACGFMEEMLLRGKTSGFYCIGDAANGMNRQTGIACGQGIHTAMEIARELGKGSNGCHRED